MICGGKSSGITSALLYLLDAHFRRVGSLLPAYVRADKRMSLGILNQAVRSARARLGDASDVSLGVLVGIDDVAAADRLAMARLQRFVIENTGVSVLMGCHGEEHVAVARMLSEAQVPFTRVFLGPFGRRELRQLATRIVGRESPEVVQQVLELLHRHRLPRNPLNIAALVAVVVKEQDLTDLNESGLLQSYVTLLLDNPLVIDTEGLGMDYRRREVLLARFAHHLVRAKRAQIPWGEAEQFVLAYFEEIGLRSANAGWFIDSLVDRRVLISDNSEVGFRYPALLYLFASKWMLDNNEFADVVLQDPIRNGEIVRHAAGLRRTDRELLAKVADVVGLALDRELSAVSVEQFDLLQDRRGWSMAEGLEDVRALVQAPPAPPTEEELDEIYDEVAEEIPETVPVEIFEQPTDQDTITQVADALSLLAGVLKNSELVEDVPLKASALKRTIAGWARLTVIFAVQEDEAGLLKDVLSSLFDDDLDAEEQQKVEAMVEHFVRLFLLTIATFALRGNVGTRYLKGPLDLVMKDREFMAETANAFFAATLYALLELPQWPTKLKELHDQHGGCPEVRRSLRRSSRPVRSCWERSWSPNQVRQGQEDRHEEGIRLAGRLDQGGVGVAAACGDSGRAGRARRGSEGGIARAVGRPWPERGASVDGARSRRGCGTEVQAEPGPDREASRS